MANEFLSVAEFQRLVFDNAVEELKQLHTSHHAYQSGRIRQQIYIAASIMTAVCAFAAWHGSVYQFEWLTCGLWLGFALAFITFCGSVLSLLGESGGRMIPVADSYTEKFSAAYSPDTIFPALAEWIAEIDGAVQLHREKAEKKARKIRILTWCSVAAALASGGAAFALFIRDCMYA